MTNYYPLIDWAELRKRLSLLWYIKATGNMVFVYVFFQMYFYMLNNPSRVATVMPLTWLDERIPYSYMSLVIYFSLWLFTAIPPALMQSFKRLCFYGVAIACLCGIGLLFFYIYPTAIPDNYRHAVGRLPILAAADGAGNAFPSMHVAAAAFSALWLHRILLELRANQWLIRFNMIWATAIALSTLATRQHVVLDVAAGACLGAALAKMFLVLDASLFAVKPKY